jgi:molecular chaperone GrpE
MKPEEENENQEEQNNTTTENEGKEQAGEDTAPEANDNIEEADNRTDQLKAELAEAKEKYLRMYSEFDNYKKRVNKERIELIKSAGADIIASLLPVLDDFERALKSFDNTTDVDALKEGISLISVKLKTTLQQKGLKEMESIGQAFDTDLHDALSNAPASEDMKGKIVEEVQKGYYLNDKVIRHAKVIIGQ